MSKGKYIMPVVMGEPGTEVYLVKGDLPTGVRMSLARLVGRRGVLEKDVKGLEKIDAIAYRRRPMPQFINELQLVGSGNLGTRNDSITDAEVREVTNFLRDPRIQSKKKSFLDGWFLYDKSGDLIPLRLARFSINFLEDDVKHNMIRSVRYA